MLLLSNKPFELLFFSQKWLKLVMKCFEPRESFSSSGVKDLQIKFAFVGFSVMMPHWSVGNINTFQLTSRL